jgi:hypothetical protein
MAKETGERTMTEPIWQPPGMPPPPEQQRFIADVRSQYDVGPEVIDEDIVTVGSQICQGAQSGSDRATLDKFARTERLQHQRQRV